MVIARVRATLIGFLMVASMLVTSAARSHAEDGPKRIAVVNVSRVFEAYEKVKDIQKKMQNLFDADKQKMEKEGRDLQQWKDKIQIDPRPHDDIELFREVQKFELAKLEWERAGRDLGKKVEEKRMNEMKIVLSDIKNAIRAVGSADKFDLVMRAPEFEQIFDPAAQPKAENPEEPKESAGDLVRKFRENPVLYFSQNVDVTEKVINKLNEDYKASSPSSPK